LKRLIGIDADEYRRVAPRTGAWIETWTFTVDDHEAYVAPRTGAWIET